MYLKLVVLFGQVGSNETGFKLDQWKAFHVSEFIQSLRMLFLIFYNVGLVVSLEKKS
jgi:hypothetical protein